MKIINILKAISYKLKASDGITLYLAMLVMSGALAVALSVSTISIGEFKISSEMANSLKAVYVADSAMEYALYQTRPEGTYICDSNTNISTLGTKWGDISSNDADPEITNGVCPPGLPSDAVCEMKIRIIPKTDSSAPASCVNSSACDCTKVTSRGSFRGVNRALEIVYPNL